MAFVDAGGGGVDDDEHFGGEILAAAIEDDAGNLDAFGVVGMGAFVEKEGGEAVLAVDDEIFFLGLLQFTDAAAVGPRLEAEFLRGEEQDGARNGGLGDGGLVEIADGADLGAGEFALEGLVGPLDAGDELADVVLGGNFVGGDGAAFLVVEPADEAHVGEELFRRV